MRWSARILLGGCICMPLGAALVNVAPRVAAPWRSRYARHLMPKLTDASSLSEGENKGLDESSDDSEVKGQSEGHHDVALVTFVEIPPDSLIPQDAPFASEAFSVPALIDDGPLQPSRKQLLTIASINAAVIGSSAAFLVSFSAMAAFMHAGPGLSLPAYLGAIGPGIWAAYQKMVFAFPVVTKSIITGITYVIGDMLAQVVQIRSTKAITVKLSRVPRNSEPLLLMDPWRYIRSGLVGLILLGPLAHYYYEFVAIYCESWAFPFKIALDQTLYLAFYNTVYYLVLGVLAGRSLVDVAYVYKAQFMNLLVAGWKLWPAVGVITYNFIPTEHRVLFVDAIEIAYSAVLSTLSNDDPHGEKQK